MSDENLVAIGAVVGVNPARRELRITVARGRDKTVEDLKWIDLKLVGGEAMRCKVVSSEAREGRATVILVPGVTRDNVARMQKATVMAPDSIAPSTAWTLRDFVGLKVRTEDGRMLGEVTEIFETAAHGVLEIAKPGGGMILVPAIDDVVLEIDVNSGVVVLRDITPYAVDDDENEGSRLA